MTYSNFQIPKSLDKEKLKSRLKALVKVDENGCWIYQGYTCKAGYARFWIRGKSCSLAHRISYALYKGRIRKDKVVDHKCGVRNCVNPEHLQAVSQSKNIKLIKRRNGNKKA